MYLEAIGEALEDMSHVGLAIRNSSKTTETARARKFVADRPELFTFELLCFIALEKIYPNAPESLLQQLGESMADRYARHLYRAPRQKALDQDIRRPPGASETPQRNTDTSRQESAALVPPPASEQPSQPVEELDYVPPIIPLSSADSSRFNNYLRVYRTPKSRSGTTIVLGRTREPPVPLFDDRGEAQCEWCFRDIYQHLVEDGHWNASGRYERRFPDLILLCPNLYHMC